jgi:hypothetical protein
LIRIEYRYWLDQSEGRMAWASDQVDLPDKLTLARRARAVRQALRQLPQRERRLIELHHFQGDSLVDAAAKLQEDSERIRIVYRSAMRRLRMLLSRFIADEFGVKSGTNNCAICSSIHRAEIEEILSHRAEHEGYAKVIAEIAGRFAVRLKSPQTIVGHLKYHILRGEER